jgi:hypothetical protein
MVAWEEWCNSILSDTKFRLFVCASCTNACMLLIRTFFLSWLLTWRPFFYGVRFWLDKREWTRLDLNHKHLRNKQWWKIQYHTAPLKFKRDWLRPVSMIAERKIWCWGYCSCDFVDFYVIMIIIIVIVSIVIMVIIVIMALGGWYLVYVCILYLWLAKNLKQNHVWLWSFVLIKFVDKI